MKKATRKKTPKTTNKVVNKKVRNATPTEIDGIKFRSKLEAFTYQQLKHNNIPAGYEPVKFVLIQPFEFKDEKIRAMTYTPDFVGENFIIECKGMPNETFPYKWKWFKWHLKEYHLDKLYKLYLVHNQKEVLSMIEELKLTDYGRIY